jgi:hypothetical protein
VWRCDEQPAGRACEDQDLKEDFMHVRTVTLIAAFAIVCSSASGLAQGTKPPPPQTKKPPVKVAAPETKKPPVKVAAPVPKKADAVLPVVAKPPPPAAPTDVHFKTKYTTGDQVSESSTYIQGNRERYEMGDMILLKQRDQKRTVQISTASNTYLVSPERTPAAASPAGDPGGAPQTSGVVMMSTSIVDTGERKDAFGKQARHVKTMVDRQPQPGACDQSKLRIETDAWYIDLPRVMATAPEIETSTSAAPGCADEIRATQNGDPAVLGFPISYRTTFIDADDKDGKPMVVSMEVTEFQVAGLDAAMFDIPQGMTAAMNPQELSQAVSNANEVKLASGAGPVLSTTRKPGALRVGVPEVANKTTQALDTRALRSRLIQELEKQNVEAIPRAASSPEALQTRATELGVDYLLMAEVTEVKASKPGGLTRMMKNVSGEGANKDVTEAKMSVQLVAPGAKPRLSTTTSGKDGGMGLKTGLGVAKFAGSMYLKMATGGMYGSPMGAFNTMRVMNMGGMGMLGNPALMNMQSGIGAMRTGMGADRAAGAASYVMQQAMMGAAAAAGAQGGTSFDAALDEAIQDAGKKVLETLKKPLPVKK